MASFTVLSDNFAAPAGTILDEADLKNCDIAALVAGGHLKAVKPQSAANTKAVTAQPEKE